MQSPRLNAELRCHRKLREQIIKEWPDLDDETLADTLEGITSLHEMIAEIVRSALEDQALVAGLKTRIDAMKTRLERLQSRAGKKREIALEAMLEAEIGKLTQPDFTVSTRAGSPALQVQDENNIPQQYWIPQAPKLDRQSLLAELKDGHIIEGVVLSNPEPSLSVRTK